MTKLAERPLEQHALRNVQSLVERNRQDTGLDGGSAEPRPIKSVAIVGAGLMGTAIAAAHLKRNLPVVIADADEVVLATVRDRIAAELALPSVVAGSQLPPNGRVPEGRSRELVDRLLEPTGDTAAIARCDLVIESIVESVPAKQRLFRRLQPHLPQGTILASNTSTIPIGRLAAASGDPGRFCGLHFCHPVRKRPLVEIVRGGRTSDQTTATAAAHAKAIGKMPIVVEDGPGFLVNRLLLPYLGEALELLLEGAGVKQIDRAATAFGMAKGPLGLLDEIGLDTTLQGGWVLAEAFPDRLAASPLLVAMVKAGRLGCKSGAGFFSYPAAAAPDAAAQPPDEAVRQIIAQWARPSQEHSAHSITVRLMLPMLLEATRVLQEGKVRDPRDIDLAALFGLGFPAFRGGLFWWADTLGAARIIEMLRPLGRLGLRAKPTPILQDLARTAGHFYHWSPPGAGRSPGDGR